MFTAITGFFKTIFAFILAFFLFITSGDPAYLMGEVINDAVTIIAAAEVEKGSGLYKMDYNAEYHLDELMARGVTSDEDVVQFLIEKKLRGLPIKIDYEIPQLACSTFTAALPNGDRIFARNHDNKETPGIAVFTNPKGDYSSVVLVNLSFLGIGFGSWPGPTSITRLNLLAAVYFPLDGMNEKGLALAVNQLDAPPINQNRSKPGITTTTAIRMLLDKAATVDEAIALLDEFDMHSSANGCYNFQIADASGDSAIVEYVNNEMNVIRTGAPFQANANFFHTPGLSFTEYGRDRHEIMIDKLSSTGGVLTSAEAMELLKAVKADPKPDDPANSFPTLWSAVYNLRDGSVDICMAGRYDKTYSFNIG